MVAVVGAGVIADGVRILGQVAGRLLVLRVARLVVRHPVIAGEVRVQYHCIRCIPHRPLASASRAVVADLHDLVPEGLLAPLVVG